MSLVSLSTATKESLLLLLADDSTIIYPQIVPALLASSCLKMAALGCAERLERDYCSEDEEGGS
eukprot:scaffold5461_cov144-Skeletonema_marinoi.AAC.6